MKSKEIKLLIVDCLKNNTEPFRPAYERRKDMTHADIIGSLQQHIGNGVMVLGAETEPAYDEDISRLMWSDFDAYVEEHKKSIDNPTILWRKKINGQTVRAFWCFGLMEVAIIVYEQDDKIVKLECYDLNYDSPVDGVDSFSDFDTKIDFFKGRKTVADIDVKPFYTIDNPTPPAAPETPSKPKRKGRVMPPKGFYVMKEDAYLPLQTKEAIYTTGKRGGGGHKYCRAPWSNSLQDHDLDAEIEWVTLLWSCVPSLKELDEKYDFYERYEEIPANKGIPLLTV